MPTYRKLPSGKINAMVRLAGHKTQTKTFIHKEDAVEWATQLESELKRSDTTSHTITAVSSKYLKTMQGRGGYESLTNRLDNIAKVITIPLSEITSVHLADYRNKRLTEVSSSTARLELQLLSRVLKFAKVELGLQHLNPFEDFKYPKANAPRDVILSEFDYRRVLRDVSPSVRPVVELSWETSMRRSEILSISRSSINWKTRTLKLTCTKNGYERDVPLTTRAVEVLKEQYELTGAERLFNMQPHSISKAFKRSCNRLGIKDVCFHTLRHTCITKYARRGINTMQLQVISGHRDIKMLARYTHLKAEDILHLLD